jgi:hypothetical protein
VGGRETEDKGILYITTAIADNSWQYVVENTSYEAPHYTIFSSFFLLHIS